MQAISTKYRQERSGKGKPINFLRHYYDLYELLEHQQVQEFIGTEDYKSWKKQRFRAGDELIISLNEAFILSDPEVRKSYSQEYMKLDKLFYDSYPSFDEILQRISKNIHKL